MDPPRDVVEAHGGYIRGDPDALPSDFVSPPEADTMARRVVAMLNDRGVNPFGVRIHHAGEYPVKLRDAKNPVE